MFNDLLANPELFVAEWYRWGVAIAFAVTFVTTLWIFFDSQSNEYQATKWRLLSLLAAIAVVPSAVVSFFPHLAIILGPWTALLAYTGGLATLLSLAVLLIYTLGVGVHALNPPVEELDYEPLPSNAPNSVTPLPQNASVDLNSGLTPTPVLETLQNGALAANSAEVLTEEHDLAPLAWLVVMNGPQAGQEFRLGEISDIGRDNKHNTVILQDPTISRQHARVRLEKEGFVLYDLASANGVSVNGEVVQRQTLKNGDRITLGQSELGFMIVDEQLEEGQEEMGQGEGKDKSVGGLTVENTASEETLTPNSG